MNDFPSSNSSPPTRKHNASNSIHIATTVTDKILSKVPKLMLSNVISLVPKTDEVSEFIVRNKINLAFIIETCLKEIESDSIVNIPGFFL